MITQIFYQQLFLKEDWNYQLSFAIIALQFAVFV